LPTISDARTISEYSLPIITGRVRAMAIVDHTSRLEAQLANAVRLFKEAVRRGRVLAMQCRYARSGERGEWVSQVWVVEPAVVPHDVLPVQSEINPLCQRLAGRSGGTPIAVALAPGGHHPILVAEGTPRSGAQG